MTSRSNSLTALRESSPIIFNLPAHYFSSESTTIRDTIPEIQQLIGHSYDDEGNVAYARIPPVLCLDGQTADSDRQFLNPCLFKVNNIILLWLLSRRHSLIKHVPDCPHGPVRQNSDAKC